MIEAAGRPEGPSPVWNIPHDRRTDFVGRQDLLERLGAATAAGSNAVTQAITGPAGVGKTRLAVEHAYAHCHDLDVVWWLRAEQTTTLRADLATLAWELGLTTPSRAGVDASVAEVRAWLDDHDRWMVVVDNADDIQAVDTILPQGGGGQVVLTSRSDEWAGTADVVGLDVLGEDEAAEYLLRRSGDNRPASALALARALGCLPIAVEKAGAYVAQSPGLGLAGYLEMFRARQAQLRARETQLRARETQLRAREGRPADDVPTRPYPASVAITCTLAVERVEEESPAAVTILRACAFLAPESVPLSLVSSADELPQPLGLGPLAQSDALSLLCRLGLARSTWAGGIAVDRVVQAVVRDGLAGDAVRVSTQLGPSSPLRGPLGPWAAGVLRLVDAAFPLDSNEVAAWDRCGRLVPHALAVTTYDEAVDLEPQTTSRLLARVGIYLQARGQFQEARGILDRALAITEVAYGPDCSEAGIHLANLAAVLQDLGELVEARRCLERALAIAEATYGDEHPSVASHACNLGSVLADLDQPGLARLCFERALALDETIHGPDHPTVASDLSKLALVLWNEGDTLEARRCYEQALVIDEALHGRRHPAVARDLANLALVLADSGALIEARQMSERALAIVESILGPGHPEVGAHLANLATVLQDCGQLARARTCLERALVIAEEAEGPEHPSVAGVLNNLGSLLGQIGEPARARRCFDRALAIDEAALGPDHPEVGIIRQNRTRLLGEPDAGGQTTSSF
ncbi:MAG: tetratricopeptide repeat protein [Actinomycetota bacterium]|nr:tetratricopeptide repeat protein [Actinomycetota bacterium]